MRLRIGLNTKEVNDPNLAPVERARLTSLQTKEFIYKADFIKLRELSATYTLPRSLWKCSHENLAFTVSDYAAIPQLRRLLISMNFNRGPRATRCPAPNPRPLDDRLRPCPPGGQPIHPTVRGTPRTEGPRE